MPDPPKCFYGVCFVLGKKKLRCFVFWFEQGGNCLSSIRGESRDAGKPKPLKKKEREEKRKKKKIARLERQQSR
jgi:hypothetical protein